MRMMTGNRVLWVLGAAAVGISALAQVASADIDQVTTEDAQHAGSIIILPKVVWDGTRDTIIQIANTGNLLAFAHCFYVNGAAGQCNETDFDLVLTKQQPTQWAVSAGRGVNPNDGFEAPGSGFDPGLVPPMPIGFLGELKCVQVNEDGSPLRANQLKGEAILRRSDGDVSEYNAIAFRGNPRDDALSSDPRSSGDPNDLLLDLTPRTDPAAGGDPGNQGLYSACPDTLLFDHFAYGVTDPVLGGSSAPLGRCNSPNAPATCSGGPTPGATCTLDSQCGFGGSCVSHCPVTTELTLVPCQEDLENQVASAVNVQFVIRNEFEERFSASTVFTCFLNLQLNQIGPVGANGFTAGLLGTTSAYTRINPITGQGGVIGVAEESHCDIPDAPCNTTYLGNATATPFSIPGSANAAFNLHTEGNRFDAATNGDGTPLACGINGGSGPCVTDHIVIPAP